MDIVTLAAARKGSGGGASKEYVNEKVAGEEITTTATGSDLTLSTSSGNLNALTVYGKSEVVDGSIKSAGEGWSTVDLGTLSWYKTDNGRMFSPAQNYIKKPADAQTLADILCPAYATDTDYNVRQLVHDNTIAIGNDNAIYIYDSNFTDPATFKTAMSGVLLCYEEATPTNNTIAVKTDNGSGINGTMAVFETGTPLRGIPETDVRDVMQWDGSSGEVTKVCGEVDLGTLNWNTESSPERHVFRSTLANVTPAVKPTPISGLALGNYLCEEYTQKAWTPLSADDDGYYAVSPALSISIVDHDYDNVTDFVAHINGVKFVYELATPTTAPLTTAENTSLAELRTYTPQTHAQNNAQAEMTVEAYAGTENGKAVADLKSELKITQSGTLTLTAAGWSSNQQTVTYAHDTAKRNVIDVDPASVEEWASCGVIATAETANGITFSCKTVPENALTFRVTSMGV